MATPAEIYQLTCDGEGSQPGAACDGKGSQPGAACDGKGSQPVAGCDGEGFQPGHAQLKAEYCTTVVLRGSAKGCADLIVPPATGTDGVSFYVGQLSMLGGKPEGWLVLAAFPFSAGRGFVKHAVLKLIAALRGPHRSRTGPKKKNCACRARRWPL